MQIKKFKANNIKNALEKVKQEFGTDAVVLSAKNIQNSRTNLFNPNSKQVEITAAVDYNERIYTPNKNVNLSSKFDSSKSMDNPFRAEAYGNQGFENLAARPQSLEQNSESGHFRQNDILSKLAIVFDHMLKQHVEYQSAIRIVKRLWDIYKNTKRFDPEHLNVHISNIISEMGVSEKLIKLKKGKRRIVTFIGKSGVGKTISAIKVGALATRYLKSQQIGFISIVNKKMGECQKAKTFAQVIGYAHRFAHSPLEFNQAVNDLKQKNLIIVDTPSPSPAKSDNTPPLEHYLTQFYPVEIHLVASANDKVENIRHSMSSFGQMPITHLLFTKLDETLTYGNILSMLINEKLPLSYFSWSPEIPGNIEKGKVAKIVNVIFKDIDLNQSIKGDPESIAGIINEFEMMITGNKSVNAQPNNPFHNPYREVVGIDRRLASNY